MEKRFIEKYGDKEVELPYPIMTIYDNYASPFSSGSNGYLKKVRVRNGKFEFYHDWWRYGWLTMEEIREQYPKAYGKLSSAISSLLNAETQKDKCPFGCDCVCTNDSQCYETISRLVELLKH